MKKSFNAVWDEIHANKEWGKYPEIDVVRFVARNYYKKDRKNIKILDFGCGAGANTWYLAREGFDVYAFDGSIHAVEKAKQYLSKENLHAEFQVSDALEIDYENNYFDCIIDSAVVCANTSKNIHLMYEKIYDLLKEGGKLLTTSLFTPNTTGCGTGIKLEDNTYQDITEGSLAGIGTVHFFEKDEVYGILDKIGFKNIVVDKITRTDNGNVVEYWNVTAEK